MSVEGLGEDRNTIAKLLDVLTVLLPWNAGAKPVASTRIATDVPCGMEKAEIQIVSPKVNMDIPVVA